MKKIVFLTGTRADFGKIKSIIDKVEKSDKFEAYVFVTGMHMMKKFGHTYIEITKQKYNNVYLYKNQEEETGPDIALSNTIVGFSKYINTINPNMIIVHGDRPEALAGAIVGSFNNILVGHIEGGEISGTIDELIRHSITKLSHIHFVSNHKAMSRIEQMGENKDNIYIIGSPSIDIMKSKNLPSIDEVKKRYSIPYEKYSIFIYHPVTTEINSLQKNIRIVLEAIKKSERNYIIIYPNNDMGSDIILNEIKKLDGCRFKIYPSIRFTHFLTLLKNSDFIIGNSSCGIMEAEVYGIPSINIGNRQLNRSQNSDIIHVEHEEGDILKAIDHATQLKLTPSNNYGDGDSSERLMDIFNSDNIWSVSVQKQFLSFSI